MTVRMPMILYLLMSRMMAAPARHHRAAKTLILWFPVSLKYSNCLTARHAQVWFTKVNDDWFTSCLNDGQLMNSMNSGLCCMVANEDFLFYSGEGWWTFTWTWANHFNDEKYITIITSCLIEQITEVYLYGCNDMYQHCAELRLIMFGQWFVAGWSIVCVCANGRLLVGWWFMTAWLMFGLKLNIEPLKLHVETFFPLGHGQLLVLHFKRLIRKHHIDMKDVLQ